MKNGLILKHEYLEEYLEVFTRKYRIIKPKLYELLRGGASLVLNKIEGCAEIDSINRQIAQFVGRQTVVSGYAAFGHETSFGNHWDTHDVFAVQLMGKKRWVIYEPTEEDPSYKNTSVGKESHCTSEPIMDVVLEAGDIFYLPRGWWHEVTASGSETFHLAIGTYPPYVSDYLNWLVENLSMKHGELRLPLEAPALENGGLERACRLLYDAILSESCHKDFLQNFVASQRLASPYAIELLGNPQSAGIPGNCTIHLNANNCHLWHGGEIVVNGSRLDLDPASQAVVQAIATTPSINLDSLIGQFSGVPPEKLRNLVHELLLQDVLSIQLHTA